MTFHITWGSIQEWGCNQADTVATYQVLPVTLPIYLPILVRKNDTCISGLGVEWVKNLLIRVKVTESMIESSSK